MNDLSTYLKRCMHAANAERVLFAEDNLTFSDFSDSFPENNPGIATSAVLSPGNYEGIAAWAGPFPADRQGIAVSAGPSPAGRRGIAVSTALVPGWQSIAASAEFNAFHLSGTREKADDKRLKLSDLIGVHKLKQSPKHWMRHTILHSMARLMHGYEAGSIALQALSIRTALTTTGSGMLLQSRVEYVNSLLEDMIPGDVDQAWKPGIFALNTGIRIPISSFRIFRSMMKSVAFWRRSNLKIVIQQSDKDTGESGGIVYGKSAYSGVALLFDMLIEAGKGALFSKPKIGFMMAANITWSVGKKAKQYSADRKAIEVCKKKQLNRLYERSLKALDNFELA